MSLPYICDLLPFIIQLSHWAYFAIGSTYFWFVLRYCIIIRSSGKSTKKKNGFKMENTKHLILMPSAPNKKCYSKKQMTWRAEIKKKENASTREIYKFSWQTVCVLVHTASHGHNAEFCWMRVRRTRAHKYMHMLCSVYGRSTEQCIQIMKSIVWIGFSCWCRQRRRLFSLICFRALKGYEM